MSRKISVPAVLLCVAAALPVAAQVAPLPVPPPQPVTTPPATYFSSAMDSLTVLVPYRARSEIEQEY
ncbi:MAG: hypothetical protein ACYDIE_13450, partial [Candidatus Krumholzibacteriia bacterium]